MRLVFLCFSILSFSIVAREMTVRLDTDPGFVKAHSVAINFALTYEKYGPFGYSLWNLEDFKAGVMDKKIVVSDDDKVTKCSYSWAVAKNPPLLPGEVSSPVASLLIPAGFSGVIDGVCALNELQAEILLTLAPYQLRTLTMILSIGALAKHEAKKVIAILSVRDENDEVYGAVKHTFEDDDPIPADKRVRVIAKADLRSTVELLWVLKKGGVKKEKFPVDSDAIVID